MLKTDLYKVRKDGTRLFRTYSTKGVCIRKVGTEELYDRAIDVEGSLFTYEETDIPIDEGVR